ncbi:phospholipase A2 [Demequina pelophila]|uniref:phospholipase A2 n=1 Tax=Demequina pelophila TaxID=1638984 RepID=UPI000785C853|nr:phospholipase A2 [Demequina pelophila]
MPSWKHPHASRRLRAIAAAFTLALVGAVAFAPAASALPGDPSGTLTPRSGVSVGYEAFRTGWGASVELAPSRSSCTVYVTLVVESGGNRTRTVDCGDGPTDVDLRAGLGTGIAGVRITACSWWRCDSTGVLPLMEPPVDLAAVQATLAAQAPGDTSGWTGSTDGCSVPSVPSWLAPTIAGLSVTFEPACTTHDRNYGYYGNAGNGATDAVREAVDQRFLEHMRLICDALPSDRAQCLAGADLFHTGVRLGGGEPFFRTTA